MTTTETDQGTRGASPLYHRVADQIAHDIRTGELRPGQKLPSERDLAGQIGVSRVTARRALKALVDDGLLEPAVGRGWFVSRGPISEPPGELLSFSEMGRLRGLTPSARVLRMETRPATIDEADALAVAPGERVLVLERLRFLNDLPICVEQAVIRGVEEDDLKAIDFEHASLHDTLERRYGMVPTYSDYTIEASGAEPRMADLLGVESGAAVLVTRQLTYDQRNRPMATGFVVFRGDRYRIRTRLSRFGARIRPRERTVGRDPARD
jgi:GntR family transcriptional regulator